MLDELFIFVIPVILVSFRLSVIKGLALTFAIGN